MLSRCWKGKWKLLQGLGCRAEGLGFFKLRLRARMKGMEEWAILDYMDYYRDHLPHIHQQISLCFAQSCFSPTVLTL